LKWLWAGFGKAEEQGFAVELLQRRDPSAVQLRKHPEAREGAGGSQAACAQCLGATRLDARDPTETSLWISV